MEVYLIRHTTPNIAKGFIYGKRLDVDVTDTFHQEVDEIFRKIPTHFDWIYTSPAKRCTKLAAQLNAPDRLEDERITEMDFGLWEGKRWEEIDDQELDAWMNNFIHEAPPEGESMKIMSERIISFWQEMVRKDHHRIALVTHAGVIRIVHAAITQTPLNHAFELKVHYGDVFHVDIETDTFKKIE
ncbi:alpha-ribazole phosphatase [Fulvivirgaceae bacterium BMA10]|uniref:Alpha-ribazole phosphatase n=1 Tax=Splendidivirga corallicola TaxID=3051826 RepID=A0ABT8KTN0_9BACT|nr:alpha-ribazole phosphatase [Fulvivirgaceae bacterium BMA10]